MADTKTQAPAAKTAPQPLTAAQAAALVRRTVPVRDAKTGKPTGKTKQVVVRANEVLDFRETATGVVVVTKDGQKFAGERK